MLQHQPEILYIKASYVSFTPILILALFEEQKSHMRKKARGKIVLFKTCPGRMWHTPQQRISAPDFRAQEGVRMTCYLCYFVILPPPLPPFPVSKQLIG